MGAAGGARWPVEWHQHGCLTRGVLCHPDTRGAIPPPPPTQARTDPLTYIGINRPLTEVRECVRTQSHKDTCHRQSTPSDSQDSKVSRVKDRQRVKKERHRKHLPHELKALSPLFIDYRSHRQHLPWHHPISPNVSGDVGADILQLRGNWTLNTLYGADKRKPMYSVSSSLISPAAKRGPCFSHHLATKVKNA